MRGPATAALPAGERHLLTDNGRQVTGEGEDERFDLLAHHVARRVRDAVQVTETGRRTQPR
jgi:hypothetical protein